MYYFTFSFRHYESKWLLKSKLDTLIKYRYFYSIEIRIQRFIMETNASIRVRNKFVKVLSR